MRDDGSDLMGAIRDSVVAVIASGQRDPQAAAREVCDRLMRDWGGSAYYLPRIDYREREARILADLEAGRKTADVASATGVTQRTIQRHKKRAAERGHGLGTEDWTLHGGDRR